MCANTGALRNANRAGFYVEDVGAGDVAGEQVRGELDSAKRRDIARVVTFFERIAEGPREGRLSRARVVFEKHVSVGEQRDEDQLDYVVPTSNGCAQASAEALGDLPCAVQRVFDG